jgi:ribosomal protein S14
MKHLISKDSKHRLRYKSSECGSLVHKAFCINQLFTPYEKVCVSLPSRYLRFSSLSRLRNRCILTGRARSVYGNFRLTRMQLRDRISFGFLQGVKKSSW